MPTHAVPAVDEEEGAQEASELPVSSPPKPRELRRGPSFAQADSSRPPPAVSSQDKKAKSTSQRAVAVAPGAVSSGSAAEQKPAARPGLRRRSSS
jgi:hypothetical protein